MKKTKTLNILEAVFAIVVCIALVLAMTLVGDLLMPHRWDYGATWDMYLQEDENTIDVMFFGSSLAYCDIVPPIIYENTGLTAYVMGGPTQSPAETYYYVRETLKTQSPQAIFIECTSAFFDKDRFAHVNVGYMPWGANRIAATFTCERDEWKGLLFPIYSYHSRFLQPTDDINRKVFDSPTDGLCGYTFLTDITPIYDETLNEDWKHAGETGIIEKNLEYYKKISEYCAERGVKLVFYFTPVTDHAQPEDLQTLKSGLEQLECEAVYDYSHMARDIGINYETQWYDDTHLNYSGAAEFSEFLSIVIVQLGIEASGTANVELWTERVEKYKDRV